MIIGKRGFAGLVAGLGCVLAASAAAQAQTPIGVLYAAGDFTSCSAAPMANASAVAKAIAKDAAGSLKNNLPVRVLLLGDLAYGSAKPTEVACLKSAVIDNLTPTLTDAAHQIMPVPGNHDVVYLAGQEFYKLFASNSYIGTTSSFKQNGGYISAFPPGHQGAWMLVGLSSEPWTANAQTWLTGAIAGLTNRCILGFWHRPVFSSGEHGHDESVDTANALPTIQGEMQTPYTTLYDAKASVVLTGHDHDYEYMKPHTPAGAASSTGIRDFVVGTGGIGFESRYAKTWSFTQNYVTDSYGYLKLTLYADKYQWAYKTVIPAGRPALGGGAACRTR